MGEYTNNNKLYLPEIGETGWGSLVNNNFVVIDQLLPIGSIISFAGSLSPEGWLICNGQTVSRTAYNRLYAVLGTIYGSGDGSTTFNLPDLGGRVIVGVSDTHMMGETGGEETHTLTVAEIPAHAHGISWGTDSGGNIHNLTKSGSSMGYANTLAVGDDQSHNNMQPYLTLNYIIKY